MNILMLSSRRTEGALLLKWRGVAARDRRLGLQHLLLTDLLPALCPESPHTHAGATLEPWWPGRGAQARGVSAQRMVGTPRRGGGG